MSVEVWKPVVGFEGYYEVSDLGRVRSVSRMGTRHRIIGRVLRHSHDSHGYPHVNLNADGKVMTMKIHRMVLEAFVGPCPRGMEAAHSDGDKTANVLSNLRWKTHSENEIDKRAHGTNYGRTKLIPGDAERIADLRAAGCSYKAIGKHFGVSDQTVSNLLAGRSLKAFSPQAFGG